MSERPPLSKAETEVARVLWRLRRATARQVAESLPEAQRRDFSTVQTFLSRLEKKGYVESELVGRAKVFQPIVRASEVIRETVNEVVDRLFDGEAYPLLKHLIADRHVSRSELDALRDLIDDLEQEHATDRQTLISSDTTPGDINGFNPGGRDRSSNACDSTTDSDAATQRDSAEGSQQ